MSPYIQLGFIYERKILHVLIACIVAFYVCSQIGFNARNTVIAVTEPRFFYGNNSEPVLYPIIDHSAIEAFAVILNATTAITRDEQNSRHVTFIFWFVGD